MEASFNFFSLKSTKLYSDGTRHENLILRRNAVKRISGSRVCVKISPIMKYSFDGQDFRHATEEFSSSEALSLVALADIPARSSPEKTSSQKIPDGFRRIEKESGLEIYSNGTDFVASIDLKQGGYLKLLPGEYTHAGSRKSGYGGVTPELNRMTARDAMKKSMAKDAGSKCVVNGSFFADFDKATAEIAYPLKSDGKIVSDGFAPVQKHKGKKLTLMIYDDGAKIVPFNEADIDSFRQNGVLDSIVSLSNEVNIDNKREEKVGRTYLGLAEKQENGRYSKAFVFVSSASSQLHAKLTLNRFGAGQVMQFDGGGSSQIQCRDRAYVKSSRTVPQFIILGSEAAK